MLKPPVTLAALSKQTKEHQYVDPTLIPEWNSWISQFANSTIFHTSNWARVLKESYGYSPSYLIVKEDNEPVGLFPIMEVRSFLTGRRGVSLPFSDYCPPLVHSQLLTSRAFEKFVAIGRARKWKSVMLRDIPSWPQHTSQVLQYVDHVVHLNRGIDTIFKALRRNYRSKIKKAQSHSLTIRSEQSLEAIATYYDLHCITRKKHKLPPQPFLFFKKIQEHILSKNLGFVSLAYHKGSAIAGAVYLHYGHHAIYKYGASNSVFDDLNSNYLIQWEAIQWAAENGYAYLSLGRTDLSNKGLLQYKNGWATKQRALNYYTFDLKRNEFITTHNSLTSYAPHIFGILPLPILRKVGAFLYPHIG